MADMEIALEHSESKSIIHSFGSMQRRLALSEWIAKCDTLKDALEVKKNHEKFHERFHLNVTETIERGTRKFFKISCNLE